MQLNADELRARLEPLFKENFEKFGELGAAVSVWQNGKPIVDLHGGFRDGRREQVRIDGPGRHRNACGALAAPG